MNLQHRTIRLLAAVGAVAALTCVSSLAEPLSDPDLCSTNRNGQLLQASRTGGAARPAAPTGRATPTLLGAYPAWDYWNLDTGAVRDTAGLVHFDVRLWEYGNRIPNHDRYVIDTNGVVVETHLNWLGLGEVPAFTDGNGHNRFVEPTGATQHFGVVDSAEYIYVFNTSAESTGWEVHYTKLDPQGNTVIDWTVITTGADCWNWYLQPLVNSNDDIIVTWIRDTSDICAIVSTDAGVTWSDIMVLLPNAGFDQASAGKAVIGPDDSIHFVWRTLNWNTYVERGWYAKVRPDWSLAVDQTVFHQGPIWYPFVSVDDQGSLHVTYAPLYDVATDMYYTRLRGDLDLGGAPATDALLTAIPERLFLSDPDMVHYPMNMVDENGTVHVAYEEGEYGRYTDKDLYYVALCSVDGDLNCDEAVFPDDFELFAAVMAGPSNPVPPGGDATDFANADLGGDGDVDLADAAVFQTVFGGGR